jgi:hypothetical protein
MGVLIMRKLIATVFNYSLDGLLADEGTEFWKFCFDLPENREPDDPARLDFLESAYAHIMGRTAHWPFGMSHTHLPVTTRQDVTPQGTFPHTGPRWRPQSGLPHQHGDDMSERRRASSLRQTATIAFP